MLFEMLETTPLPLQTPLPMRQRPDPAEKQAEYSRQTALMLAVRDRRDREAFADLFDFFAPRLKSFVMKTGVPAGQAEEIVQEVMLTVWHKAQQFDPHRAQVSAWVYRIARNRQIDVLRRENRPLPEELDQDPGNEPDACQIFAVDQEAEKLKRALKHLKTEQRNMIEKVYYGDLSHREISAQTGIPLGTIKSRIRLGLERLRYQLEGLR